MALSDPLGYEHTLSALQGLIGRPVTVFIGGAAAEPGLIAYSAGTLQSAAPDERLEELYRTRSLGEALHFRIAAKDGAARLVFVLFERFFGQGLWSGQTLVITQRPREAAGDASIAIWLRLED